jgi:uncharacterized protein YndB with AHSA1/START domain
VSTDIRESIVIHAPPARVFAALLEPAQLQQWWTESWCRSSHWRVDARVGGDWESRWEWDDGRVFRIGGTVRTLDPPVLLEYDWWDDRYPNLPRTLVRYDLRAVPAGTELTVTHTGFGALRTDRSDYAGGWSSVLSKIARHVTTLSEDSTHA